MISDLSVLKWLHAHGCPWGKSKWALSHLEGVADLSKLEGLGKYSVEWFDEKASIKNAQSVIDFLRANDCPWEA